MNLVKWDPFAELEDVSKSLNRIFGRFPARPADREALAMADWAPTVDISETDSAYMIKGEIGKLQNILFPEAYLSAKP